MSRSTLASIVALFGLILIHAAVAGAAVPDHLTLNDLANHPERWPASVTLKGTMRLDPTTTLRAGQSLRLAEIQGSDVIIDAGKAGLVAIGPEDCDLVDAANKAWATLTPAQRAVDLTALTNDASLWPDKIKASVPFDLTNGKSIPAGQELTLGFVDNRGVTVYCPDPEARPGARVIDTDLISRARERALIDPAQRKSRIVEAIRGIMMDSTGKPFTSNALDDAKVIVLYHGANWCQPCHQFSPSLVKLVTDSAAANPHLFVAMLSDDDKDADTLKYATDGKMPWPIVGKANFKKDEVLKGLFGNYIPQLVVLDHYGKMLATGENNGGINNTAALQSLTRLIATGAAK